MSLALTVEGRVFLSGFGRRRGIFHPVIPARFGVPQRVCAVAAGHGHGLLLGQDGEVWTCGRGGGLLAHGGVIFSSSEEGGDESGDESGDEGGDESDDDDATYTTNHEHPLWRARRLTSLRRSLLPEAGDVATESGNTLLRAIEVAAGHEHSIVRVEGGEIFVFGDGGEGQLGLGEEVLNLERRRPRQLVFGKAMSSGEGGA